MDSGSRRDDRMIAPAGGAALPPVDERLAPTESRIELIRGAEIFAAPSDEPHGTTHFDLAYVLGAHVAPGYRGAVDMLTRTGEGTDIAPDASIFPEEREPSGRRKLEELAFEVTSEQALRVPTLKARDLIERGVRRVFCILVKEHRVLEWSREIDGWRTLPAKYSIEDRCLARPLPVEALLDATAADRAIVAALAARGSRAVQELREEARTEGEAKGRADGEAKGRADGEAKGRAEGSLEAKATDVLAVLRARGIDVPPAARERIARCRDAALLESWLERAATLQSIEDILESR